MDGYYNMIYLVGGFNMFQHLPLWKMMESVGMMTFPISWESHNPFHGSSHHQPENLYWQGISQHATLKHNLPSSKLT